MVGAAGRGELLDDGPDDRVLGHGPRQARQDAGEGLGLGAAAVLEGDDRLAVAEGGEADDRDEPGHDPVEGARLLGEQPGDQQESEEEERAGEDPPGAADPCDPSSLRHDLGVGLVRSRRNGGWRSGAVRVHPVRVVPGVRPD